MSLSGADCIRALALAGLALMVVGHLGQHDLDWRDDAISTFAARGPIDHAVTTSMVLSALTVAALGFAAFLGAFPSAATPRGAVVLLAGSAAAGLVLVACFEEAVPAGTPLEQAEPGAIRVQAHHDAGLLVFFLSTTALLVTLGAASLLARRRLLLGTALLVLTGLAWQIPRTTLWGAGAGAVQRASLFCLWLGFVLAAPLVCSTGDRAAAPPSS